PSEEPDREICDAEEFLYSEHYLGLERGSLFPGVEQTFLAFDRGEFHTLIDASGIGSGKTWLSALVCVRALYRLSTLADPHVSFGCSRGAPIVLALHSRTSTQAG